MRSLAMSIRNVGRTAASRAGGRVRATATSIAHVGHTAMCRAEGPLRHYSALILRLGPVVRFDTEGVRAQAVLAFTVSFVLAMVIGTAVFPQSPKKNRAPTPDPETVAGPAEVAPRVDLLPRLPSAALRSAAALPRSDAASKRPDEASRLLTVAAAEPPQASAAAVRTSGTGRSETARVTEISLWGSPSKPWVSITTSGPVRYQLRNVAPNWVVMDLSKAELALTSGHPPAGRGLVKLIRVGQFAPGTVRVVLELTDAVPFHVATSPGRNAIVVSLAGDAKGSSDTAPSPLPRPGAGTLAPITPPGPAVTGFAVGVPSAGRRSTEMASPL